MTPRWVLISVLSPSLVLLPVVAAWLSLDPANPWCLWLALAFGTTVGTLLYAATRAFSPSARTRYLDNLRWATRTPGNFLLHALPAVVTLAIYSPIALVAWWWFATPLQTVVFWMSLLAFWQLGSLLHDLVTLWLAHFARLKLDGSEAPDGQHTG
jgi:hypothetical protein